MSVHTIEPARVVVGRRMSSAGKRIGPKYSDLVTRLLKEEPESLTPQEVMRCMHELCYRYLPAYYKKYPGTKGLGVLPFEPAAPIDVSWNAFYEVGAWLVDLHQGFTNSRATHGPNIKEVQWVSTQVRLRLQALQELRDTIKKVS